MNKEHFFAKWLIRLTRTHATGIRWIGGKRINPNSGKIPLCSRCNTDFGRELEEPVRLAFLDLEAGRGLSDVQAERIVRWLWKFVGLAWRMMEPEGTYTQRYTVRDRVLRPIDEIRPHLTLAISLAEEIDAEFGDAPMGLDVPLNRSAVCTGGVFSRIVVVVLESQFEPLLDAERFTFYRFGERDPTTEGAKLIFPKTGFRTCVEAVAYMVTVGKALAEAHEAAMMARGGADRT